MEIYIAIAFAVIAVGIWAYNRSRRKKRPPFGEAPYNPENDPLARLAEWYKRWRGGE